MLELYVVCQNVFEVKLKRYKAQIKLIRPRWRWVEKKDVWKY